MHLHMDSIPGIEKNRILNDIGIGIVSGGFSGIAVSAITFSFEIVITLSFDKGNVQ